MSGWWKRWRRVDVLDAEVTTLRASLARIEAEAAIETERARGHAAIERVGTRLADLHDHALEQARLLQAIDARIAALTDRVDALDSRAEADDRARADEAEARAKAQGDAPPPAELAKRVALHEDRIARLHSTITSLERQMRLNEADLGEAAAELLRRVEAVSPAPAGTMPS